MDKRKENNVAVAIRIRPLNDKEVAAGMPAFFTRSSNGQSVLELNENGAVLKHWSYDYVFGPESTNEEVFETVGLRLVDAALEGYNTVIFLYGQTASGKTYTLFGENTTVGVVEQAMEYGKIN